MSEYDLSDATCGTCGNGFEEGDTAKAIWAGTVNDEGLLNADTLDFHHTRCVSVKDSRDPAANLIDYENADGDVTVHCVRLQHRGDGDYGDSLCGAVSHDSFKESDVRDERRSARSLSSDDNVCSSCAAAFEKIYEV